jgi:hypothetical protein
MPFTTREFLDVFAAYNTALWPLVVALWVVTAAVLTSFVMRERVWLPLPMLLLAGHWLWSAVVYHAFFFTAINPAAWLFAALFVLQAVFLIVAASSGGIVVRRLGSWRHVVSSSLIVYGLVYPAIAWADGFAYPHMPTFGVPCPTVILTIGFLIGVSTSSILLSLIPVAWSLLGISAVLSFGIHADLVLPAAGVLLVVDLIRKRSHAMKTLSFARVLAVVVALSVFVPAAAIAQANQHDHAQQAAQKGGTKMDQMKMGDMKMDAKMMEEMAAKNKANTARLNALMATVKSSTGEAKVAAMADVMAVLLEERTAMQEHCASMVNMMNMMHTMKK